MTEDAHDFEDMVDRACRIACREGFAAPEQSIVVTAGVPLGTPGATNLLRIALVGKNASALRLPMRSLWRLRQSARSGHLDLLFERWHDLGGKEFELFADDALRRTDNGPYVDLLQPRIALLKRLDLSIITPAAPRARSRPRLLVRASGARRSAPAWDRPGPIFVPP